MGKIFKYGLAILFGLIIIGALIITYSIDSIVKSNIERVGTEMTGTAVTVQSVSISPYSGKGSISGFRVANPEGYSKEYALEIDEFSIHLELKSLFSNEVMIREIIITGPELYVEQKLPENNLTTIMNHINNIAPNQTTEKDLIIDYFLMEGGSTELYTEVGGERTARVELSKIELHDLGRGGGRNAVESIIQDIAQQVAEKGLQAAVRSGGEQLRDAIRDLFD